MKQLIVASHNTHKVAELKVLLEPLGIELIDAAQANLPDVEETEATFKGNARLKVESAFEQTGLPCMADDSGFCVDALGGAPGVYSARYEGGYKRVLEEIKNVAPKQRSAHFICVIAYKAPNEEIQYFEGKLEGVIPVKAKGTGGFGYDPIFIPKGENETFGEMEAVKKNSMSARSIALSKLIEYIKKEG